MDTPESTPHDSDRQSTGLDLEALGREAAQRKLHTVRRGHRELVDAEPGPPQVVNVPPLLDRAGVSRNEWQSSVLALVTQAVAAGTGQDERDVKRLAQLPRFRKQLIRGGRRAELASGIWPLDLLYGSDDPSVERLLQRVRKALIRQVGLATILAEIWQRARHLPEAPGRVKEAAEPPESHTLDLEAAIWPLRNRLTEPAARVVEGKRRLFRSRKPQPSLEGLLEAWEDEREGESDVRHLLRRAHGPAEARALLELVHRRLDEEQRRVLRACLVVAREEGLRGDPPLPNFSAVARRLGPAWSRHRVRRRWKAIQAVAGGG